MKNHFLTLSLLLLGVTPSFSQTAEELNNKANKQMDAKDFRSALKTADEAIAKEKSNCKYYMTKAEALIGLRDYNGAEKTYSMAVNLCPDNGQVYNNRGNLYLALQKTEEAISDFTNEIEYSKSDTLLFSGYLNRGAAKGNKRDFKGAYDDYMQAYKIDPRDIGLLNNLGIICFDLGMEDEGFEYLKQVLLVDSSFIGGYVNLGFNYQLKGQYEKSIIYFDKAQKMNPNEPLVYSNRSYSKMKLGDLKGAMKDIEKSIKIYPGNSYAYRNRALIYIEMKDMAKACADLQQAKAQGFLEMYGDEVEMLIKKYCK